MKTWIFLLLTCILATAVVQLEVQPPCDDSYIHMQDPTISYGTEPSLCVINEYWHAGMWWQVHTLRSLVKFNNLPTLPESTQLGSCYIELHDYNVDYFGTPPLVVCCQLMSVWNEETVNWNNQPTLGPLLDDIPLQGIPSVVRFNITPAVHDWYEDSSTNHGVMIMFNGGKNGKVDEFQYLLYFRSKEFDISNSPKLILMCCEVEVEPISMGNLKALYHQ